MYPILLSTPSPLACISPHSVVLCYCWPRPPTFGCMSLQVDLSSGHPQWLSERHGSSGPCCGCAHSAQRPLRTVHSRCAVAMRRALGTAAVTLVLGVLLMSHISAPLPSELSVGVTSRLTTFNGATRPAVAVRHKSSGPQTQSHGATVVALGQSVGVGPSVAEAMAMWCWGSWGPPSALAGVAGWGLVPAGLLFVWGCRGRFGLRWRMLRTTGMGDGEEVQPMAAQGPAPKGAVGVLCGVAEGPRSLH